MQSDAERTRCTPHCSSRAKTPAVLDVLWLIREPLLRIRAFLPTIWRDVLCLVVAVVWVDMYSLCVDFLFVSETVNVNCFTRY
jgi:hypothetical protein